MLKNLHNKQKKKLQNKNSKNQNLKQILLLLVTAF